MKGTGRVGWRFGGWGPWRVERGGILGAGGRALLWHWVHRGWTRALGVVDWSARLDRFGVSGKSVIRS